MSDLNEVIQTAREAVESTSLGHADRVDLLNDLAHMLALRSKRTGDMSDLDEAVQTAREVVELTPLDHANYASGLNNLGLTLYSRYERTQKTADLDEGIEVVRKAVELTPLNHANKAPYLNNLGNILERLYVQTSEMVYLDEAIEAAKQAVELTPNGDPNLAGRLNNLDNKLQRQFLDKAILEARNAVNSIAADDPSQVGYLNNLGQNLQSRYEWTGEMTDLEGAIQTARKAIELTRPGHTEQADLLHNLANRLSLRYERTSEKADLEEAIEATRKVVELTPLIKYADLVASLNNLARDLGLRYARTGEPVDLDEAIETAREAVRLMPLDDNGHVYVLITLGNVLAQRYERTGEMTNLEEAIQVVRKAVRLTPADHANLAGRLHNLGSWLRLRYQRKGKIADLEEAIEVVTNAVELTPLIKHADRARRLGNLATNLGLWYKRTGKMADLEEAIEAAREAVRLTPFDHANLAVRLNILGINLGLRCKRTGKMADVDEAIKWAKKSVELMPPNHADLAGCLNNLGVTLEMRYKQTSDPADMEQASLNLLKAWHCQTTIPFIRIEAAARCLKLLALQSKIDTAIPLGKAVLDLLPAVNTKLLDRADQQFVMSTFAGVAADLCSFLLASNCPEDALKYLERGRAAIISQLLDRRSDISTLAKDHPTIAQQYESLVNEVNTPLRWTTYDAAEIQATRRRREAVGELDACIREIRRIAGHERFMLGQTVAEMKQCAAGGTIVVVNITSFRSDAILVSQADVKTVFLPRLLASDAEDWLGKKWTGSEVRSEEPPQKNKEYLQYLIWLWDVCVSPILDKVCSTDNATERLPRVWWIGTGLGSSMPFHAAGVHSPGSTENAMGRVVSSYTPSIKALRSAQQRAQATYGVGGSLMIATMPTTPAQKDLPGVVKEKEKVTESIKITAKDIIQVEPLDQPSVAQVIDKLRDCYIAHFACHGSTDHTDPSNSGLILQNQDGQEVRQDRLTVQRVSELNLASAHIAFLSACSTAENKAARLSDEVIHVVSGFQVAGFPHVVGCLWPSFDRICVEAASEFYLWLFLQPGAGWNGGDVAWAVREAVMAVREAEMEMPLAWAQFVHFGA